MEAKNIYLNGSDIMSIIKRHKEWADVPVEVKTNLLILIADVQRCQAEISFKAGYTEGEINGVTMAYEDIARMGITGVVSREEATKEAKQAGIKKVVEWIEQEYPPASIQHPAIIAFLHNLKAKLKEWGL